jgi:hypothetical protein
MAGFLEGVNCSAIFLARAKKLAPGAKGVNGRTFV